MAKVGRKSVGHGTGTWACVHAFNDAGGGKDRDMGEMESLRELGEISKAAKAPVSFQPVNLGEQMHPRHCTAPGTSA
jgi:hypothetical protein